MTDEHKPVTLTCEACGGEVLPGKWVAFTYDIMLSITTYAPSEKYDNELESDKTMIDPAPDDIDKQPTYIVVGNCCRAKLVKAWTTFVKAVKHTGYGYKEHDYTDSRGYFELYFDEDINQHEDEPLDTVNAGLMDTYGGHATIDWRDDRTCWIWVK